MEYTAINTKKSYEKIIDHIVSMIKKGQLQPGERLESIEKLASNFGVSRSVIREALTGLRMMGLVHIQHGEGTFIANFNHASLSIPVTASIIMKKEDIKELLEVRKILESGAVRLAALHHTQEDIQKIEQAIDEMKNNQLDETADYHFHYLIIQASQNKMLMSLLESISKIMIETIHDAQKIILNKEETAEPLIKDHELIYQAIINKQPDQAEKYMLQHLKRVETFLEPYINR
ncbi:FadR/GntR family transcriptional regulator [Pseudogracilibacillus sp. SE30717A]|uniref:FadR/GntR family transcriptional regulator n=1 Tax=Pseudogracilibacillus sp. SE30717A TaxID=3098293 RepID=UPI00300DEB91